MSSLNAFRQWAATSTLAHVAFAFLAMGGWAAFANRDHDWPAMLLAGVVQGSASALLTLGLKKFLEWLSAKLAPVSARTGLGAVVSLAAPPLITATTILALLTSLHSLAGTPEIAATIAVPFTVSTSYAILYNLSLWRRHVGQ